MRLETVGRAADLINKVIATYEISYVFFEKPLVIEHMGKY